MAAVTSGSFDFIAPFYPRIECFVFGNTLSRMRNLALDGISPNSKILLLGEGNGRFLLEVLRRYPRASITCLEPSAAMVKSQRKRIERELGVMPENVTVISMRFQDWDGAPSEFDCIVAHYFLDLFGDDEIGVVIAKIGRALAPRGRLFVAEFVDCGWSSRTLIRTMYVLFFCVAGLRTQWLPDWQSALRSSGWRRERFFELRCGIVQASEWTHRVRQDKLWRLDM